jgi:eukaryotic-like serine/threonine-protein kinase
VLTAGRRVGSYEIVGLIGAGGMGEVYRATDTRLGRDVALKVLPEDFAADPDRSARFEREARVLASLNHPNIAAIYGFEDAAGIPALVMELAPGSTLAERIARGPMPVEEAVPIARQVAEALEYAHEHGVVHRDLKPANVKVTEDGAVKVLDFGLAKALGGESAPSDLSMSPTLTGMATRAGVILGTAAYMAPEQARGKPIDKRADIWAFGVVLFEMLSGRRLFSAETASDTLAAVLRQEIDLADLPAVAPNEIRALLARCLERDPGRRLRDIGEARIVFETPFAPLPEASEETTAERRRGRSRWVAGAVAAGIAGLIALSAFLVGRNTAVNPEEDVRMRALTFRRGSVLTARFVPGGRSVVYGAAWDGAPTDVFSVRLDTRESRPLGLSGADVLSVSSTGELAVLLGRRYTVGWESTGTLARLPMDGGAPRQVLEGVQDADWSPDGTNLAVVRDVGSRRRLEFPIGRVLYETGGWISHPRVSPDGKLVAFLDHPDRGDNIGSAKVVDGEGHVRTVAARASNGLAWSADGKELLYPSGSALQESTLAGDARVIFRAMGGLFLHDVSSHGDVLVSHATMQREIVGAAPGATHERNLSWLDWSFPTALSGDGRVVLFEEQNLRNDGDYALFMRPTGGEPPVRLGDAEGLAISADGKWVLGTSHTTGTSELVMFPTGPGETRRLGPISIVPSAATFLPDGERAVLAGHRSAEGERLFVLDLSSGVLHPISPEGISDYFCNMVSPDGRLAFATGPDGTLTLYPIDGASPSTVPGTSRGDVAIRWSADGRSIFVQHGSGVPARVELVDVASGRRTLWRELTPPDPAGVSAIGPIAISADGRAYVYSYRRKLDQLFVVEGLR